MTRIAGFLLVLLACGLVVFHLKSAPTAADISVLVMVFAGVIASAGLVAMMPERMAQWQKWARGFLPAKWTGRAAP